MIIMQVYSWCDTDKKPRERSPAWKKPPEGGPVDRLQKLYQEAKRTPSEEKRYELVYEMIKIHIEHGPFFIGTAGNEPMIGVVKNYMKNVPGKEDLHFGGFAAWTVPYPAMVNPPTFWMDK